MKKFTFLMAILVMCINLVNAQVPRKKVIVEIATGTGCPYCPGAALGAEDLVKNGKSVGIIEYHSYNTSDPYYNTLSETRNKTYYGVKGYPTANFDGQNPYENGDQSNSLYSYYLPKYNTAIAVQSPVDISISVSKQTNTTFSATVTVTKAQATVPTFKLMTALTQSNITYSWQGQTELHWVARAMYPDVNGTNVTFSGNTFTYTCNIDLGTWGGDVANGDWEFVAFVQESTKKIDQGEMFNLKDASSNTPPVANFSASATSTCIGIVNFTDQSTNTPTSWSWNFGDGTTSTQQNPSHTYATNGTYTVTLEATNAYGNDSEVKTSYITVNKPAGPTITSAQRCGSGVIDLSASGSGSLDWYDAATNGNKVNTGTSYSPNLTSTTTFYVESNTLGTEQSVGMTAKTTDGAYYTNTSRWAQVFDAITPLTIKTVKVYAGAAGNRTIWLANSSGTVIDSVTVNVPNGESVVTLNLNVPAGTGWQLGGQANCNLWRDATGSSYPYTISNLISITGSTASSATYYYYFYDWKVQAEGCISNRTPVTGTINAIPAKPTINVNGVELTSSANSGNQWYLNGNTINGATGKTYTCTENGAYKVKVTENDCSNESDPTDITVGIVNLNSNNIFNVTPNPCFGIFTITVNSTEYQFNKLSIYNLLGKEIMSEVITNNNFKKVINLEGLTKGIYLVKISGANQTLFKKVVIE